MATAPPAPDSLELFYREKYFSIFGADQASQRRVAMFRLLLGRIPFRPPGRLLDVGCGAGHFLALARDVGWEVAGVDPSAEACAVASQLYGLEVRNAPLEKADLPEAAFQVITLINVLDQAPNPLGLLMAAHRVLRPGGVLVIRVPNGDFHRVLWRLVRHLPSSAHRTLYSLLIFHSLSLSARSLRTLLGRLQFQRIRVINSPISGSELSVSGGSAGRITLSLLAFAVRTGSNACAALTAGRVLCAPSLIVLAERNLD